jgi:DNA-binding NarL/FixJ family response regulator
VARRVFIIWAHPLFHQTLRALLVQPGIEVVGDSANYATAEIEALHPDVIIIEESETRPTGHVETLRLLEQSHWAVRIVRLSLQDNEIWMYQREQKMIGRVEELVQMIVAN